MGLFGTAGVRDTFDKLNCELAWIIGNKFAQHMDSPIVIGMDARKTSSLLSLSVSSGAVAAGKDIIYIGEVPTPTLEFYAKHKHSGGAFMITASHNPAKYNGIKVVDKNYRIMPKEKANEIYEKTNPNVVDWKSMGKLVSYEREEAINSHIKAIKNHFNYNLKKLSIAVDYGNGVGTHVFSKLINLYNIEAYEIFKEPDGTFPNRPSEPTKSTLKELIRVVREEGYDAGIAFDGDCDRVVGVDEKGNYLHGDVLYALSLIHMYESGRKGNPAVTVGTSKIIEDIAKRYGFKAVYTKVGTTYLQEEVINGNAMTGGEEVGGVIWPEVSYAKDGFSTAINILAMINIQPLSEWTKEIPRYYTVKGKVSVKSNEEKQAIMKKVKEALKYEERVIDIDGIRVDYDDLWFIIRPSGTEPIMRYFVEAKTEEKAHSKAKEIEKLLEEIKSSIG